MDMITFEHIDVHALNNTVSKKMRTLERPHSLMLDDDMPFYSLDHVNPHPNSHTQRSPLRARVFRFELINVVDPFVSLRSGFFSPGIGERQEEDFFTSLQKKSGLRLDQLPQQDTEYRVERWVTTYHKLNLNYFVTPQ